MPPKTKDCRIKTIKPSMSEKEKKKIYNERYQCKVRIAIAEYKKKN